jgi:hypothetical protein
MQSTPDPARLAYASTLNLREFSEPPEALAPLRIVNSCRIGERSVRRTSRPLQQLSQGE